jgi:hypothetical protein
MNKNGSLHRLKPLGNDRWAGEFQVSKLGRYQYSVEGWTDRFRTWRDLVKRINVWQDVPEREEVDSHRRSALECGHASSLGGSSLGGRQSTARIRIELPPDTHRSIFKFLCPKPSTGPHRGISRMQLSQEWLARPPYRNQVHF